MSQFNSILLIGCGNMGGAMLAGWLEGGVPAWVFTIADPKLETAPEGVTLRRQIPAEGAFDAVLLGVKPQMLGEVAPPVEKLVGPQTVLLSILAGVELATLADRFPRAAAIVRVMPNLAAALGKSPIALVGEGLADEVSGAIDALMAPLGHAEWLASEGLMDLVTALAGSGPAFVYRFIDALASGAADLGLDADQAQRLAVQMVEGAAALAAASVYSPSQLAIRVASPGGTTQVGIDVLDQDDRLARLMVDTLRGARDRSAEMSAESRSKP